MNGQRKVTDKQILNAIAEHSEFFPSYRQLAEVLGVSKQAVHTRVKRLVEKGVVVTYKKGFELTEKGRKIL